ncbi:hypothetical protein [Candidatus Protochlamydia naegleriophila]|uniref:hypothetical protein n=1 Tax=Candidatus Protochlamydia naegleriophila TaxID=389348 RepID=UPI0013011C7E|nr:hypothetical protein [Candidatus Protochlamydia naegleriophila]
MKHSHLLSTYPKGLLPAQACAKDVHLAASLFSSFPLLFLSVAVAATRKYLFPSFTFYSPN